jgi:UDP-N-acetylglucosamine/UDP-N-acetylgalactosamine diphosphorylase
VQIIGVDNVLNKVLDPLHLGFSIDRNFELSIKTVDKRNASEKIGVIGKANGKYQIIEYTELSDQMRNLKEADGMTLKFRQG